MDFEKLLIKVAKILDQIGAVYCLTGGYAVSCWGRPRTTFDIDVIIEMESGKINILAKKLKAFSRAGYLDEESAAKKIQKGGEFNFIHPETGLKIDFWAVGRDPVIKQELKRRIAKKIKKQTIYFISPEDLILSKLRWFKDSDSSRHLDDARSVLRIQKNKLDLVYLKKEAKKQQVEEAFNMLSTNSYLWV